MLQAPGLEHLAESGNPFAFWNNQCHTPILKVFDKFCFNLPVESINGFPGRQSLPIRRVEHDHTGRARDLLGGQIEKIPISDLNGILQGVVAHAAP